MLKHSKSKKTKNSQKKKASDYLTIKHRRFLDFVFGGMCIVDAAKAAGFRESYAYKLYQTLSRKQEFVEVLNGMGLDNATLGMRLLENMGANVHKYNPKNLAFESFPDNQARLKALEMALQCKGFIKNTTKVELPITPPTGDEARLFVLGEKALTND